VPQENKRVMIFIDGSNLYHALKAAIRHARIDFQHLCERLVGPGRDLVRAYYYNSPVNQAEVPEQYRKQQKFFGYLRRLPYFEVRLGRLARRGDHLVEKGVDVRLAVDMLANASTDLYDVAVLLSGDADFSDAVQAVKNLGKHVELAYPLARSLAGQLRDTCDVFVPLTKGEYLRPLTSGP